jgi:hypothetical protein
MEAIIGGLVFAVVVPVFSQIIVDCIMGGSFSDLLTELLKGISIDDLCWIIPAMISGLITFAAGNLYANHKSWCQ